MTSSAIEHKAIMVQDVRISNDTLTLDLDDGRTISVPLGWYPRLLHGSPEERANWRKIGNGEGIHWPDLDEDISVKNLLNAEPSGENSDSLRKWLQKRS